MFVWVLMFIYIVLDIYIVVCGIIFNLWIIKIIKYKCIIMVCVLEDFWRFGYCIRFWIVELNYLKIVIDYIGIYFGDIISNLKLLKWKYKIK